MTATDWLTVLKGKTTAADWLAWAWWLRDEVGDVEGAQAVETCVGVGKWPRLSIYRGQWFWYLPYDGNRAHPVDLKEQIFQQLIGWDTRRRLVNYPSPLAACLDLARVLREERAATDEAAARQETHSTLE